MYQHENFWVLGKQSSTLLFLIKKVSKLLLHGHNCFLKYLNYFSEIQFSEYI